MKQQLHLHLHLLLCRALSPLRVHWMVDSLLKETLFLLLKEASPVKDLLKDQAVEETQGTNQVAAILGPRESGEEGPKEAAKAHLPRTLRGQHPQLEDQPKGLQKNSPLVAEMRPNRLLRSLKRMHFHSLT